MQAAVLIHNPAHPLGLKLQEMLQARVHCANPALLALGQAEEQLSRQPVHLAVVVLSPLAERALEVLARVRELVAGPVLAVGDVSDSKLILRTLHEGADHYLDEDDLDTQFAAVLQRLQIKSEARAPAGRLIAVLGSSGGTGASTLAVNLAASLARSHKECALIDLKPGVGDLAALLDVKPVHNLADLCLNAGRMDRAMFESALVEHPSGIYLLAPPQMYEDIRLVTAQGVQKTLGLARERFGFTVVDLEDCYHEEQAAVLRQSDFVLLVLRLDFTSLRNTRRILDHLRQAGVGEERVRLVINRFGQAKELPLSEAEEALGRKIAQVIPDDPKTINSANNAGVPAVLRAPSAKVSASIGQLAGNLAKPTGDTPSSVRKAVKSVNGWLAAFHS
jgi:pilus assembly protein CpaE